MTSLSHLGAYTPPSDADLGPYQQHTTAFDDTTTSPAQVLKQEITDPESLEAQNPASPSSIVDMTDLTASGAQREFMQTGTPTRKRMSSNGAVGVSSGPSRRNGVRKKNARIAIPYQRSLAVIEQLIQQSQNQAELKELKSQRRLLRNREAA